MGNVANYFYRITLITGIIGIGLASNGLAMQQFGFCSIYSDKQPMQALPLRSVNEKFGDALECGDLRAMECAEISGADINMGRNGVPQSLIYWHVITLILLRIIMQQPVRSIQLPSCNFLK